MTKRKAEPPPRKKPATKVIRVDDEVYAALQARAKPFEDSPNIILRRLLKLK